MRTIDKLKNFRRGIKVVLQQFVVPLDLSKYGKLGLHSVVKANSSLVPRNMYLDDWCVIQDRTNFISLNGKLIVKKYSVISSGCTIVPASHRLTVGVPFYLATTDHINDLEGYIIIDEDCWIGAECILLPNVHIGLGAVVGAGSVVTKDVPPYAVVAGVPAKIIAIKFTKDQILKHEAILYSSEERMSDGELQILFDTHFHEKKSIGNDNLSDFEMSDIERLRSKYEMKNYNA